MITAVEQTVERMGLKFERDGMPRIAGRILGLLLLRREPLSLDDLAAELRVSKTSISTNTRLLERMGTLEQVSMPGDRRDYYRVAIDMHTKLLDVWMTSLRELQQVLDGAHAVAPATDAVVRTRLLTFSSFFEHLVEDMEASGRRWVDAGMEHEPQRLEAGASGRRIA